MTRPAHLLQQLAPSIDLIASIAGVPGVSVGVIHDGDVVFRHNYGYGDLSTKRLTTSDTIYPIASLSKSFTSFLYGSLVDEGRADWSSPIREALPEFHSTSTEVSMMATPIDLLSQRTGIAGGESLYWHAQALLNDSDIIPMFGSQPPIRPFRTDWLYNNLGYAIVGLAMSARTGQSFGELFESRVAQPFGLQRTGLSFEHCQSCDLSKTYLVTEDGTAIENETPFFGPNTAMVAAGGICSSVNDLLVFYRAMLQKMAGATDLDPSLHPLKGLSHPEKLS
jgi:CubicO group peptidase (beta-lactamase class C family)